MMGPAGSGTTSHWRDSRIRVAVKRSNKISWKILLFHNIILFAVVRALFFSLRIFRFETVCFRSKIFWFALQRNSYIFLLFHFAHFCFSLVIRRDTESYILQVLRWNNALLVLRSRVSLLLYSVHSSRDAKLCRTHWSCFKFEKREVFNRILQSLTSPT